MHLQIARQLARWLLVLNQLRMQAKEQRTRHCLLRRYVTCTNQYRYSRSGRVQLSLRGAGRWARSSSGCTWVEGGEHGSTEPFTSVWMQTWTRGVGHKSRRELRRPQGRT